MGYYQGDYYMAGGIDWGKLLTKGADVLSAIGPQLAGGVMTPSAETGGLAGPLRQLGGLLAGGPPGMGARAAPGGGAAAPRGGGGGGGGRRYRRMNPGNVRALRRSMRRVQSFAKLARHTMTFVHAHKLKHHRKRR